MRDDDDKPAAKPAPKKPTDPVLVTNRHAGQIAGVEPGQTGTVTRADLARYPWALREVAG